VRNAIRRENQLEGWRREKKIALIRGTELEELDQSMVQK